MTEKYYDSSLIYYVTIIREGINIKRKHKIQLSKS